MFASPVIAAFLALMLWWMSTGLILLAVRRADQAGGRAFHGLICWGLPFLVLGAVAVMQSVQALTVAGMYIGFAGALCIWGWIEMTFLTGLVTGPRKLPMTAQTPGERFAQAWGVVAYHETLLLIGFLGIVLATIGQPNPIAAWTYGMLLFARVLAKLNLFNGVPGINTDAVPTPLSHITSYFRTSDPSWVFPLSVTVLSLFTAFWVERLVHAATDASAVMFAFLSALTALALLEHWMMLIPLADTKLWRWMMPDRPTAVTVTNEP